MLRCVKWGASTNCFQNTLRFFVQFSALYIIVLQWLVDRNIVLPIYNIIKSDCILIDMQKASITIVSSYRIYGTLFVLQYIEIFKYISAVLYRIFECFYRHKQVCSRNDFELN